MILTETHKRLLEQSIPVYRKYLQLSEYQEDIEDRQKRQALFQNILAPDQIDLMTELEFGQVISPLWACQMWGNKRILVDKMISENGLPLLRSQLKNLLWGSHGLASRYDEFRNKIKGFGTATLAEIMAFIHPADCGIWNDRARTALKQLGFDGTLKFIAKHQLSGQEYQEYNHLLGLIVEQLKNSGFPEMDYLGVNYYFYEIWRASKESNINPVSETETRKTQEKAFVHSEVIDQLIAIGQALGFQTEKEKLVAKGAKVDVVWQAHIANLGVIMYVFEVQSHGSIDSLILNLQRAQVNQSVQRLIVVASAKDIEKIRGEVISLPESFRRAVSYWEASEAMRAAGLVDELFGIINKLELVKSEFGT